MANYPASDPAQKTTFDPTKTLSTDAHTATGHNNPNLEINAIGEDLRDTFAAGTEASPGATATSMLNRVGQILQMLKNITGGANWYSSVATTISNIWTQFQVEHTTAGAHTTNSIAEKTSGAGVTVDGVLLKDNGVLLPNNTPYQIKNAAGTAKNVINKNASDQTTVGENNYRATRFVPLDDAAQILTNGLNTNFTDIDVTANTSANTYAIACRGWFKDTAGAPNLYFYVRKNGSAATDDGTIAMSTLTDSAYHRFSFIVPVDTNQIFEYKVTAGIDDSDVWLVGYFEYAD